MSVWSKDALDAFESKWNQTTKDGTPLPYGIPTLMQLTDAVCDVTGNGKEIIKMKWVIMEGEFEGTTVPLNIFPFASVYGAQEFKKWASFCGGFENPNIQDAEELVAEIANQEPVVKIQLRQSGTFTNGDYLERVDSSEVQRPVAKKTSSLKKKSSEAEEADEDSEEVEIEPGSMVELNVEELGGPVQGKVTKVSGDTASVEVEHEGEEYTLDDVEISELTLVDEEAEEDEEEAEEEGVNDELRALAEAIDVEVAEDDTDESLAKKLEEFEWKEEDLEKSEVEILKAAGVDVIAKKTVAKKKAKKSAKKKTSKKK